jgi:uncharacterized protein (TIGR02996 family)
MMGVSTGLGEGSAMTEREALLRAVCENPDDDTPRLVFADWLQENGEDARAEFIRIQIRLEVWGEETYESWQEWQQLCRRKLQLYFAHEAAWRVECLAATGCHVEGEFERGFPERIRVEDWSLFAGNAERLFQLVPIQAITFQCPKAELEATPTVRQQLSRLQWLDFSYSTTLSDADILALLATPFPRLKKLELHRRVCHHLHESLKSQFGERIDLSSPDDY